MKINIKNYKIDIEVKNENGEEETLDFLNQMYLVYSWAGERFDKKGLKHLSKHFNEISKELYQFIEEIKERQS